MSPFCNLRWSIFLALHACSWLLPNDRSGFVQSVSEIVLQAFSRVAIVSIPVNNQAHVIHLISLSTCRYQSARQRWHQKAWLLFYLSLCADLLSLRISCLEIQCFCHVPLDLYLRKVVKHLVFRYDYQQCYVTWLFICDTEWLLRTHQGKPINHSGYLKFHSCNLHEFHLGSAMHAPDVTPCAWV